ncbi:hypothetical protein [Chryseobacterium gambrini]|uniref:TrkA C-terminal domain-containing protein n=1 Tax=Chryseobacterium gambrini TaxID=373672 RepID=A0A1N7NRY3_9FLAO|nr:hypothetical protein [Chryseobacterium gambrini]HAO07065.1 hypothetical protein [Chryseobacterium sp.]MBL7881088.1 hypothetical protein [Chryseobacterium gambrini]WBV52149.1 hypothetical protein PFY09_17810 [Chryseobacterium gambrini]SIT01052.1 hypothetical protein SAMN05421785_10547 [Chryseobacterium gambrini]BEV06117.1 TrkA C-terminal domain-containing protein [Chryseobacterium gambrini]
MKKIFLYILAGSLCFTACKKDDEVETFVEPEDISVRNSYDDQAIQKFMDGNYLDSQGNIKAFSSTDTSDDNEKKLSELNPVKLPSGVIYIIRNGAQPNPGKAISSNSQIKTMIRANYYLATQVDGNVSFTSTGTLVNTINDSGSPVTDPSFYYVKQSVLSNATLEAAKNRSYYEIEGFQEGLKYFESYDNLPDGNAYNLQGVIIVPSRAAFARDVHYNYVGYSLQNSCFVFNFQLYNSRPRPVLEQ